MKPTDFLFFVLHFLFQQFNSITVSTNCTTPSSGLSLYYDTTILDCLECPLYSSSIGKSCVCNGGYYWNTLTNQCTACPPGTSSTRDRSACLTCPVSVNNITKECECPVGQARIERDISGLLLQSFSCTQCPSGAYSNSSIDSCAACPIGMNYDTTLNPWQCKCDLTSYYPAGSFCVPLSYFSTLNSLYPVTAEIAMSYPDGIDANRNPLTIQLNGVSDTFNHLYLYSAYKCSLGFNTTYCQSLANLCVLKLYFEASPDCQYYLSLNANFKTPNTGFDNNWKLGFPFLFYSNSSILKDSSRISFSMSFDPNIQSTNYINKLDFKLAKFDIYGNYYGMENLTDQFYLCNGNSDNSDQFKSFGSTIINNCDIDLSFLFPRTKTMYFYQLFLNDPVAKNLIDIPVLITNVVTSSGRPNTGTVTSDFNLTSRFFIFDNLSGISIKGGFISNTTTATVLRYAKTISLNIQLNPNLDAKIYTPFLNITYESISIDSINPNNPSTTVSFQTIYYMDISNFMRTMMILFIVINCLVGIIVSVKMYIWYKNNPYELSPDNYILWFIYNFVVNLLYTWSHFIFWFIFAITAYWYVFFKLQYTVFILLPEPNSWSENYRSFDIIFGIAVAAFTLVMIHKIYTQTSYDIFFIDWEHDKDVLVKSATELKTEKYKGAWRTLFIVNEFNELQNYRSIYIEILFIVLVFFWYAIGWEYKQESIPNSNIVTNSPINYRLLGYFISSFVLLISILTSYVLRKVAERMFLPSKKIDFIDLLTNANLSIFILDTSLHGFYIHGQSPSGKSDTNIDELLKSHEEEAMGKVRNRGFDQKDPDNLQTYEIYVSYNMRQMYDGFFGNQTESMMLSAKNKEKMNNQSRLVNPIKTLPKTLPIDKLYKLKSYINSELKEKIQKIRNSPIQFIQEKTSFQRFLDFPPLEAIGNNVSDVVFFKDPNMNFDSILFTGIEWDWLIWNLFVFQFWQIVISAITLSILLTLISDWILWTFRAWLAERNLARKSIIDKKFLL